MSLFKRVISNLFPKKDEYKIIKNEIFEIPYDEAKVQVISVPNINNQSFKISKWYCKVGENILDGKVICELESDKATIEFECYISGKLVYITNKKTKLKTGDVICKIENI